MRSFRLPQAVATLAIFGLALALRLEQHHAALLYPDGYQYLLMARGISEHFEPTTLLGPGGEVFVPSADAAAKPLFPLLVAIVHAFGASWLSAAEIVTAAAGAAAITAVFLLASRLGGSWLAGAAAALVLLASPTLAFWSGFSGPDPVAQALGLGAALAFLDHRPRLGGVLLALAVATRPELILVALVAGAACAWEPGRRAAATRGAVAFALTLTLVFAALRTPIEQPDVEFLWLVPLLLVIGAAAVIAPPTRFLVGVGAVVLLGVLIVGSVTAPGLAEMWGNDWPLLGLGLAGLALTVFDQHRRRYALAVLLAAVLLGTVYWVKNPALERYFAIVLPLAAVLVGVGVAALSRSRRSLVVPACAVVTAVVAVGFVRTSTANHDQDVFSRTAQKLSPVLSRSDPLVTAAPDAYGFWLPAQPVRTMRPGVRGMILLDPAQRSYASDLTASGRIVARFENDLAFSRPDGEIDVGAAILVAGSVTATRPRASDALHEPRG